jgi:glycosyltransferase involved in cell wall biosynthesis
MKVAFLLSKDPVTNEGGDVALVRVILDLLREEHDVVAVCQSPFVDTVERRPGLVLVPKEPVHLPTIAWRSLRTRRSLVHARFDSDAYVAELDRLDADLWLTDHSYMAEPFLRSRHAREGRRLLVSTTIQESLVWGETRGLLGRLEAPRIARDELRVARAAHAVATYDEDEARAYREAGIPRVTWLDVTLPPVPPVDVGATPPRAVFLGHRGWPPNARGAQVLRSWWPRIAEGIPGAELWIVGPPPPEGPQADGDGVRDLGFVDDVDEVLAQCRFMAAPIDTGGGVRVKVLDAASRGLPVVTTSPGVGSLAGLLGLDAYDEPDAFIGRCRELLLSAGTAAAEAARLHDANRAHWDSRAPHRSLAAWLGDVGP